MTRLACILLALAACRPGDVVPGPLGQTLPVHPVPDPTGSDGSDGPDGPDSTAEVPPTQIGSSTGTTSCVEVVLPIDSELPGGETLAEVLALVRPGAEVAPAWFDDRAEDLWVEVVYDGGEIVGGLSAGCAVTAGAAASFVSDSGAVDASLDGTLSLADGRAVFLATVDDADWTGTLDPAALHDVACEPGSFVLSASFEAGGWQGQISHRCPFADGRRATTDTTDTTDTDTSIDTGTLTSTTFAPTEETALVASWEIHP